MGSEYFWKRRKLILLETLVTLPFAPHSQNQCENGMSCTFRLQPVKADSASGFDGAAFVTLTSNASALIVRCVLKCSSG